MGWYYDFRPYVSVAERRRQALREMEKRRKQGLPVEPIVIEGRTIARTFWGKAWCDNLESYSDYANRLPRGRTYVRNGSVVHLEIEPGKIKALVSGSELYRVEITISPLPAARWKAIKKQCSGQIGSLVELLQGRLSKGVMDVVTRHDDGLFPKPSEITLSCSCPDWAGMCKHVAAVMYGVGARLDTKPELLFLLRRVDHLELIAGAVDSTPTAARGKARGKKTIAAADLADVFGIEMAEDEASGVKAPAVVKKSTKPRAATSRAVAKKLTGRAASAAKNKSGAARPSAKRRKVAPAAAGEKKPPLGTASRRRAKASTS
jgi:uncharacterized Zn finger protein